MPAIVHNVVGAAFPGAVVDMHDGGGDRSETVAALPQIITQLRAMGYAFVSICGQGLIRTAGHRDLRLRRCSVARARR